MKLALILNVIDPLIGGVLIMGHRGTGKSTAVRAISGLLPQIARVKGCVYGCDPDDRTAWCDGCARRRVRPRDVAPVRVVELPLGATEDRVAGTLNIERALKSGVTVLEPGLLARANRGFLYIDEVNLLEDYLVDLLLDVAASGRNIVEREGVSTHHPARFVLIGSGNPEEGELRPQLLDRFGLYVTVSTIGEIDSRIEIMRRRERYERNPAEFVAQFEPEQLLLRQRIERARQPARPVSVSETLLYNIAAACQRLNADGHRGENAIMRCARALAAFDGRESATDADVRRVAPMCLRHRIRKDPLSEVDSGARVTRAFEAVMPERPAPVNGKLNTANQGRGYARPGA